MSSLTMAVLVVEMMIFMMMIMSFSIVSLFTFFWIAPSNMPTSSVR